MGVSAMDVTGKAEKGDSAVGISRPFAEIWYGS